LQVYQIGGDPRKIG